MFTVDLIVLAVHALFGGKTGRNLMFVVFGGEGGGGLAPGWNELPSIRSFDVATSHERGVFAAERNHWGSIITSDVQWGESYRSHVRTADLGVGRERISVLCVGWKNQRREQSLAVFNF